MFQSINDCESYFLDNFLLVQAKSLLGVQVNS